MSTSSSSSKRAKVLMVGPVNGQLRLLSDKLRTLQRSKAGPFDVCLCAGPFFLRSRPRQQQRQQGDDAAGGPDAQTLEEERAAQASAAEDGVAIAKGTLSFDVPVLFVDPGDGPPPGLVLASTARTMALAKDDDEIDLDEAEEGDGDGDGNGNRNDQDGQDTSANALADQTDVPEGLWRVAPNLYQLVGESSSPDDDDDGAADILGLPLPIAPSDTAAPRREHPLRLVVGFLPPKARLPCPRFERKAKHPSFLGCDVLLSGEWGQGMTSSRCGALTEEDRMAIAGGDATGSYDVAELVAASRPRYHLAPGPSVPVPMPSSSSGDIRKDGHGDNVEKEDRPWKWRRRFVASLPYRYPDASDATASNHAGRFLAMADVASPSEFKSLGKTFKFIHAVGIVPLAHMDANDREAAREAASVVDCPYTDLSYDVDDAAATSVAGRGGAGTNAGGLSEARARRIAQEDAARAMGGTAGGGGHDGGAYRWQQRPTRKRPRGDDHGGDHDDDAAKQAFEEDNPDNRSLFLHGLHRDPGRTLTADVLMDAFRPFGCVAVRFPKPRTNPMGHPPPPPPSFAFLDFTSHEEASRCLADLKGEAVVRNIMLTLKWSSSPTGAKRSHNQHHHANTHPPPFLAGAGTIPPPPPPPPKRRNRITEAEAADSTTLFLRLPPSLDSSSYPKELETMRLLAQSTMEDELNTGMPPDSAERITAEDEPALRVTVRQPNEEMNYGFLNFASHAAALTTLVALTGQEDGGAVSEEKLVAGVALESNMDDDEKASAVRTNVSHLNGVTLYWAKGAQPKSSTENQKNYGLSFHKRHFPPDSRTDCWFCLASPTCEKHLIIAVYEECYITMPKGAVNEYHCELT